MLVTVTLNLMHRLEDFQAFKEKENISGDYNAKILYIVRYFHVSDKTVENLLSGKYVSRANYLSIFHHLILKLQMKLIHCWKIWLNKLLKKLKREMKRL